MCAVKSNHLWIYALNVTNQMPLSFSCVQVWGHSSRFTRGDKNAGVFLSCWRWRGVVSPFNGRNSPFLENEIAATRRFSVSTSYPCAGWWWREMTVIRMSEQPQDLPLLAHRLSATRLHPIGPLPPASAQSGNQITEALIILSSRARMILNWLGPLRTHTAVSAAEKQLVRLSLADRIFLGRNILKTKLQVGEWDIKGCLCEGCVGVWG